MTTSDGPWLTPDEQATWRTWLEVAARLPVVLGRDLQQRSQLSLADFDVLVPLSEHEEGRLRFAALAEVLQWERSRLSHHVGRMQRRGLVDREECLDDARGAFVVLTDQGRAAIEQSAPDHAALVRSLVFDRLSSDEVDRLGELLGVVATGLAERSGA